MKKVAVLVLFIVLLCGCSQEKETPSATTPTNSTAKITEAVTENPVSTDPVITEEPIITENPIVTEEPINEADEYAKKGIYYIGGLTADEIFNKIIEITKTIPAEGTKVSDIKSMYDISNNSTEVSGSYKIDVSNYDITATYVTDFTVGNFIYYISYYGLYEAQMDGSIKYRDENNSYSASVKFILDDYNKAVEVYDKLIEYCKSVENIINETDYRNGTSWNADIGTEDNAEWSHLQMSSGTINDITIYEIQVTKGYKLP